MLPSSMNALAYLHLGKHLHDGVPTSDKKKILHVNSFKDLGNIIFSHFISKNNFDMMCSKAHFF